MEELELIEAVVYEGMDTADRLVVEGRIDRANSALLATQVALLAEIAKELAGISESLKRGSRG